MHNDIDFEELSKKAMAQYREYIKHSPNPKWHRTKDESSLKSNFLREHHNEISQFENQIIDVRAYDKKYSQKERIDFFDKSISAYEQLKKYCYRTKGGKLYFQDMWEHCHNAQNPDFAFVDVLIERRNKLQGKLQKDQAFENLKNDLYETLSVAAPILQSELIKFYDLNFKNGIMKILREFETQGIINREKHKTSYMIEFNK